MKRLLIYFSILFLPATLAAQSGYDEDSLLPDNVVRISPFGLLNKVQLSYEYVLEDYLSVGVIGSYHYLEYSGYKVQPFARAYFTQNTPTGFYLGANGAFGFFGRTSDFRPISDNAHTIVVGGGGGAGYQIILGDHFAMDFYLGGQYLKPLKNNTVISPSSGNWIDNPLSPGFPVVLRLMLGYAF